jgi:tRNA (guanine-N7-)-methyltransferase
MDWSSYYPAFAIQKDTAVEGEANENPEKAVIQISKDVEVADIGCGFGGLLVALAPELPGTLILGMLNHSSYAYILC